MVYWPVKDNSVQNTADNFNTHFANVGKELADLIPDVEYTGVLKDIDPLPSSFELTSVNEGDVLTELKKLINKNSHGLDGISSTILKLSASEIAFSLSKLINRSFSEGKVPTIWKTAKIIPLHKNGDKSLADNYRPISLLPVISKVIERIVQKQLLAFEIGTV